MEAPTGRRTSAPPAHTAAIEPLALSAEEETAQQEYAENRLLHIRRECSAGNSSRKNDKWKCIKTSKTSGVKMWEKGAYMNPITGLETNEPSRTRSTTNPAERTAWTYAVRSTTTVRSSVETLLKVLEGSSSSSFKSLSKILYDETVADACALYHNDLSHHTSLAVRWLYCRCTGAMVMDCDFCLMDYTKASTIDDKNIITPATDSQSRGNPRSCYHPNQETASPKHRRTGLKDETILPDAYKLQWSTETRRCPDLMDTHHVMRACVPLSGIMLYQTDNHERTDVVFYMSIVSTSATLSPPGSDCDRQFRAVQRVIQQMARGMGKLNKAVDAYAMSQRMDALHATRWVANTDRKECAVCSRRFHALARRRHHCRLCGDIICRKCSVYKHTEMPTVGSMNIRVCTVCEVESKSTSQTVAMSPEPQQANEASPIQRTRATRSRGQTVASCPKPVENQLGEGKHTVSKWSVLANAPESPLSSSRLKGVLPGVKKALTPTAKHSSYALWADKKLQCSDSKSDDKKVVKSNQRTADPSSARYLRRKSENAQMLRASTDRLKELHVTFDMTNVEDGGKNNEDSNPLDKRYLSSVQPYEDILVDLCDQATALLDCKFAALALHMDNGEDVHYLQVAGNKKLTQIAANMRCCEPVLALQHPILTRNAQSTTSPFDFTKLPVVRGPQQAAFYAGVPLRDDSGRTIGALCVFDTIVSHVDSMDEPLLSTLKSMAFATMTAMDERAKEEEELKELISRRQTSRRESVEEDVRDGYVQPNVAFYKRQMQQLVVQAQRTQEQMLHNSIQI